MFIFGNQGLRIRDREIPLHGHGRSALLGMPSATYLRPAIYDLLQGPLADISKSFGWVESKLAGYGRGKEKR
jgi:hypothetical protein